MRIRTHNNLFLPSERQPDYYEDPLSRAAVLVMRLVPLAYQSFLDLACGDEHRESVALLPRGDFKVQRSPSANDTAERLLSVFLTPNAETPERPVPVRVDVERDARHDGFIQHESELIVVIEAKRHDQQGWEQAEFPGRMDIEVPGTVRFVKWVDLADHWTRLTEDPGLVGPAEREIIRDFLALAVANPQINATSRLARCQRLALPIAIRLQAILSQALNRQADARSGWGPGGEFTGLSGAASVLALSIHSDTDPPEVRLQVWAALQRAEADAFYGDLDRLGAVAAKANVAGDGRWTWHVWTALELKSQRDTHKADLTGANTDLEPRFLAVAELKGQLNRMVPKGELAERLKPFLVAGLTSQEDVDDALGEIGDYGYSKWKLVAPANVYCAWPLEVATEMDDEDRPERNHFVGEVRKAAGQLTRLVGTYLGDSD
jgi:hypothetical protein